MQVSGQSQDTIAIGHTDLRVSPLGVGTWQWGDAGYWTYGRDYQHADVADAYKVSRAAGVTFFDTAEIYGRGESEKIVGDLVRGDSGAIVATKFAPLPGRWTARAVSQALDASLARLGMTSVDLYQVHWPYTVMNIPMLMNALADFVEAGKARAIGVSNYSARQMRRAHDVLARRGIPLASNQVNYSLLHRHPERNGVLMACRDLDVRLIAYSPLAQGILSGKYHTGAPRPEGVRRLRGAFRESALRSSLPLIQRLEQIGAAHGGKTPSQVALNWLIRRGALPIPGAKNGEQAAANAGALDWMLTDDEFAQLSMLTARA